MAGESDEARADVGRAQSAAAPEHRPTLVNEIDERTIGGELPGARSQGRTSEVDRCVEAAFGRLPGDSRMNHGRSSRRRRSCDAHCKREKALASSARPIERRDAKARLTVVQPEFHGIGRSLYREKAAAQVPYPLSTELARRRSRRG